MFQCIEFKSNTAFEFANITLKQCVEITLKYFFHFKMTNY